MFVQRHIKPLLESQLQSHKVIVLVGARRVGKTVLMNQLADSFNGPKLLLNGDDLTTAELLTDRRVASYKRAGFEVKWKTNPVRFPKAFQTAYPTAPLTVVNPDTYLNFTA